MVRHVTLPEGTVTFLSTDIEGSTRLLQELGDDYVAVLRDHRRLLREAFQAHHGQELGTEGDSFFIVFAQATNAVDAAIDGQRALVAHAWPEGAPVRVRMGLHTGTPTLTMGEYIGLDLHRAARISNAGHGGQILLSQSTLDLVADALPPGVETQDLGSHRLKDLQHPEFLVQLVVPDLPADFPALRSLEAVAHNLPIQLTRFVGREREMAELRELLAGSRLVTLTGAGGCGKTRLALQVAAELVEEYRDGVWLAELAALSEPDLVPQAVAAVLGVREEPGRVLSETLTDSLRRKRILLMLDNCEHLVSACAHLSDVLLRSCPYLKILATSREALGVAGEVTWNVPSLDLPDLQRLPSAGEGLLSALTESEAARLFIDRARLSQPRFALTRENGLTLARVCHRLDGIPLAIELAAARIKVLSLEQLEARLDDRFRLLTGGSRTALPRQQTLRAAIDWSYDLLTGEEQFLLRWVSVFSGGFVLEAAEAVCAVDGQDDVLDLLTRLVDKSLVVTDDARGEVRYRLLETLRQYGAEKLEQTGEAAQARKRHRDWFLALAERAAPELTGAQQGGWLERLEQDHDNLRAALACCRTEPDGLEAELRLVVALYEFWDVRGYWGEAREHHAQALSRGAPDPTELRARALNQAGIAAMLQGDYAAARFLYEESLAIRRALGDRRAIAGSLHNLASVIQDQGEYETARALYEEARSINRELGNQSWEGANLDGLATMAFHRGDYLEARSLYEESLALAREAGDWRSIANTLRNLGVAHHFLGDRAKARTLYEESLAMGREVGDRSLISGALGNLGILAADRGEYVTARCLYEESLAIERELGSRQAVAYSLHNLGEVAHRQGDDEAARALYEESLAIKQELGDQWGTATSFDVLGILARDRGDLAAAEAFIRQSLELYRDLENRAGVAAALCRLGNVTLDRGDSESALSLLRESLTLRRELADAGNTAESLEALAVCHLRPPDQSHSLPSASTELGVRLLGAAAALREVSGARDSDVDRDHREQEWAAARTMLGEDRFVALWEAGRGMGLDTAVDLALHDRDASPEVVGATGDEREAGMTDRFRDRQEAGEALARVLAEGLGAELGGLLVLGIPRGGVVVASEVARVLDAPLDVVVPRKLTAPERPELAIGAVIDGDLPPFVDEELARLVGATPDYLEEEIARQRAEIARRLRAFRGDLPPPAVSGATVLLVDDGIATGYTFRVALEALRREGPRRLIAAVPVAPEDSLTWLHELADTVLCLRTPDPFLSVGVWYEVFDQTSDAEVVALLRANRARRAGEPVEEGEPEPEHAPWERAVAIPTTEATLEGILGVPPEARGVVLFAHGSGSGRHSRRNTFVAQVLQKAGLATLLFDLLTPEETRNRQNVFDIDLLADRLLAATRWVRQEVETGGLPLGYFGASTGAAAALQAAARVPEGVAAVVSRGGRPDLAETYLGAVAAPTLLIVGGEDGPVIGMNEAAFQQLRCPRETVIIPGAGHLFEEPGAIEDVAVRARDWFQRHLI